MPHDGRRPTEYSRNTSYDGFAFSPREWVERLQLAVDAIPVDEGLKVRFTGYVGKL